jgi:cholesterol transport system auxiliary component
MTKTAALLVVLLSLAGCAGLSKPTLPVAAYDFGLAPATPPITLPVRFSGVAAAPGLSTTDIRYRLAYQDGSQVRAYANSRWVAPPAELISQQLRQSFAFDGAGPCRLSLELMRFDQIFDSATASHVSIQLNAVVRGSITGAQQQFNLDLPAISPDAQGGVSALIAGSRQLLAPLAQWAQHLDCKPSPASP